MKIKNFFILISFFFLFLFLSCQKALAVIEVYTIGSYVVVLYVSGECPRTGTCNVTTINDCTSCASQTDACCDAAGRSTYTQYLIGCTVTTKEVPNPLGGYSVVYTYTITNTPTSKSVCSIGDKCIAGEKGLRSGNCTCGVYSSSIYKYCCEASTGNPVNCVGSDFDGQYPLEGSCPGGSYEPSQGVVGGYYTSWSPCVPKNTCTGTCYTKYTSTQTSCSGFNAGSSIYSAAAGSCGVADQLCCNIATTKCTTNSQCDDASSCTTDVCKNPGTASASCTNTPNGTCTGMYYCNTSTKTCKQTSSNYSTTGACEDNLDEYLPGQTTGVCYTSASACSADSVCAPAAPVDGCVNWDCPSVDGICGPATGGVYPSAPTSGLCAQGDPSFVYSTNGYWLWYCNGYIDTTASPP